MKSSALMRPFRRLQGRLALSYILVTLAAAFTLEVATILVDAAALASAATPSPKALAATMQGVVPQIAPYLDTDPPSRQALSAWVSTWAQDVRAIKASDSRPVAEAQRSMGDLAKAVDADAIAVIVGRDGQVLAAVAPSSAGDNIDAARLGALLTTPQTQAVLSAAMPGTGKNAADVNLTSALPDGRTIAAVPIVSYQGHVLGALLVVTTLPPVQPTLFPRPDYVVMAVQGALPGALWLATLASIVGAIFGIVVARGLTRRLRRITQAASAWSRGDFRVAVRVSSPDELGLLARDLNSMAEQIQTLLSAREQLAVVEERNRLARDLHDSIKQNVFATALLVGAARTHLSPDMLPAQTYLAEAEALAEQTRQELTALIRELRPARLADKGLAVALRDYAEDWSRRMGIAVAMHVQGERVIALDVEEALFRVAQEALANIAHHSGATHTTIHLAWDGARVRLTIADDGNGFDVAHANGRGVGLASMRERVAAHNGALDIASTAGATTVEATIPLRSAEKPTQEATL